MVPYRQGSLDNSKNQSTGGSPHEILYGPNFHHSLGALTELPQKDFTCLPQVKREQAEYSLAFVNTTIKTLYDQPHKRIHLSKENMVYIKLHQDHEILGTRTAVAVGLEMR